MKQRSKINDFDFDDPYKPKLYHVFREITQLIVNT